MKSSTSIIIRCPALTDEQKDELFELLEDYDGKWLKRDNFDAKYVGNDVEITQFGCGIEFDDAECLIGCVLEDFFEKYFLGKDCSMHVRFSYMNVDGTFEWNLTCKDGIKTFEDGSEIYDTEFQCPECENCFEVEFDPDSEEMRDSMKEEKIVCPHCDQEFIRKGNMMYYYEIDTW